MVPENNKKEEVKGSVVNSEVFENEYDQENLYYSDLEDTYDKDKLEEISQVVRDFVSNRPVESTLISIGVGSLLGLGLASALKCRSSKKNTFKSCRRNVAKSGMQSYRDFEEEVKQRPMQAVSTALVAGVAIGSILKSFGEK